MHQVLLLHGDLPGERNNAEEGDDWKIYQVITDY